MRSTLACLFLVALTACQTTTSEQVSTTPSPAIIEPGSEPIDLETSTGLFKAVCLSNYPNNSKSEATLASLGFAPNMTTGTFYDGRRDVSFKLSKGRKGSICSMVFASKDDPMRLAIAFAVSSTAGDSDGNANVFVDPKTQSAKTNSVAGSNMSFSPRVRANNKLYFSAHLSAAK